MSHWSRRQRACTLAKIRTRCGHFASLGTGWVGLVGTQQSIKKGCERHERMKAPHKSGTPPNANTVSPLAAKKIGARAMEGAAAHPSVTNTRLRKGHPPGDDWRDKPVDQERDKDIEHGSIERRGA